MWGQTGAQTNWQVVSDFCYVYSLTRNNVLQDNGYDQNQKKPIQNTTFKDWDAKITFSQRYDT